MKRSLVVVGGFTGLQAGLAAPVVPDNLVRIGTGYGGANFAENTAIGVLAPAPAATASAFHFAASPAPQIPAADPFAAPPQVLGAAPIPIYAVPVYPQYALPAQQAEPATGGYLPGPFLQPVQAGYPVAALPPYPLVYAPGYPQEAQAEAPAQAPAPVAEPIPAPPVAPIAQPAVVTPQPVAPSPSPVKAAPPIVQQPVQQQQPQQQAAVPTTSTTTTSSAPMNPVVAAAIAAAASRQSVAAANQGPATLPPALAAIMASRSKAEVASPAPFAAAIADLLPAALVKSNTAQYTPTAVAAPVPVVPYVPRTTFATATSAPRPATTPAPTSSSGGFGGGGGGFWNVMSGVGALVTPWLGGVYTGLSFLGSAAAASAAADEAEDARSEFRPPGWSKTEWVPGATMGPMAMPTAGVAMARNDVWHPAIRDAKVGPTFQIILTGTPDIDAAAKSLVPDVDIYDIDMFTTDKSTISQIKAMGKMVICYFSAGTYEPDRPDSGDFPSVDLGQPLAQWPNEKWVNLTSPKIRDIVAKRIGYAHEKGCDGIDPDNVDGYQSPRGGGLSLTADDTVDFIRWMSDETLKHKMAVGLKNALDIIPRVQEYVHFAVNEECVEMKECFKYNDFVRTWGKPVFHIEYPPPVGNPLAIFSNNSPRAEDLVNLTSTDRAKWCDEGTPVGQDILFQTVIKPKNLDGYVQYCNGSQFTTPTLNRNGGKQGSSGTSGGGVGSFLAGLGGGSGSGGLAASLGSLLGLGRGSDSDSMDRQVNVGRSLITDWE